MNHRALFSPAFFAALLVAGCATLPESSSRGSVSDWSTDPSVADADRLVLVTLEQDRAPARRRAGSTPRGYGGPAGYAATGAATARAADLARRHDLVQVDAWPIEPLGVHCVVYRLPEASIVADVLMRLAAEPGVESAQPMHRFETQGRPMADPKSYDDPYLSLQHALRSLGAEAAHRWASGAGVGVAVIDTAVDAGHPDLVGRVRAHDFVARGRVAAPGEAHGTAVSGVIVSSANNGLGIVGVAPRADLVALRACWTGEGGTPVCNSFTLARALSWVLAEAPRLPRVVNLSLAGPQDALLERLIRRAAERGVAVVAAVDERAAGLGFPAGMPEVIAVAGSRPEQGLAPGVTAESALEFVVAPAEDILTTLPSSSWDFLSGSSLAAAHVSGVLALVLERAPELSPAELAALLRASVRPTSGEGSGGASVNACVALVALGADLTCAPAATPVRESRARAPRSGVGPSVAGAVGRGRSPGSR